MNVIDRTRQKIYPQDSTAREQAKNRLDQLTMPHWALGDVMDLAIDLAGMSGTVQPVVKRKAVVVMAADHGVVQEGVSKYPQEVTSQMVFNFVHGGAGINALAKQAGADVHIVDMGVNADLLELAESGKIINKKVGLGTANIVLGPAMSKAMATRSVESGIEIGESLAKQYDMIGTGDMGIGNTTPSTAIAAVVTQKPLDELTGRGTGLDDQGVQRKIASIQKAIEVNNPDPKDGLDILSKVGGFEIGGIAGVIIGAAAHRKPVVLDGFISTAAALIAYKIEPFVRDYLIFAHRSVEKGHSHMQEFLGCSKPLLDLSMRLGEGTGSALAMNIVEAAAAVLSEVATFEEASVASSAG